MGKIQEIGYSLKDVSIVPSKITYIDHRSDVDPFIQICGRKSYPIFVAPMGAVTDENNYETWIENNLTPVIPRSVSTRLTFEERLKLSEKTFVSFSLSEFSDFVGRTPYNEKDPVRYICVDLANGHMFKLLKKCEIAKLRYGNKIVLMTGNIANPNTYDEYCRVGIDYVRVGIGGGSRCTTSANGGVHYPMATLLDKICKKRNTYKDWERSYTKIVADGGIYNFDDINKCLAIGADAVMIGRVFAECEEACGEVLYAMNEKMLNAGIAYTKEDYDCLCGLLKDNLKPYREYYGMSTKQAQKETGGKGDKTAEGISKPVLVKYPVAKWVDNMQSYLRSSMAYSDSKNIEEFNENAEIIILGGSGDYSYRK